MENSKVDDKDLFQAIDEGIKNLGKTNIIIVGRSGVGKSTLINAIFKKEVAETNDGSPVTQTIQEHKVPDTHVTLFDTRGFEMREYMTIVNQVDQFIKQRKTNTDRNEHIHMGWMCISEAAKRVEDGERVFVEMLQQHMPVIIIVTQCYDEESSFVPKVENMFEGLKVVSVIARKKHFRGGGSTSTMGLEELTKITEDLLPEAHRIAFIAAHDVNFRAKLKKSQRIVTGAVVSAAAACAIPIPFAGFAMLVLIQAIMIMSITTAFGFKVDGTIKMTILEIWRTASYVTIGEVMAANLLKLIPGVGSIAGAVISIYVTRNIMTAFGKAYIGVLSALFKENNGEQPTAEQLLLKCKELKNKETGNKFQKTNNNIRVSYY